MSILLPVILLLILVILTALIAKNGLWSNTILLVNVITAGLVAVNFFEPLATYVSQLLPILAYLADVVLFWALFSLTFLVLKTATDRISQYRMRFKPTVDLVGGSIMGLWTSWVFVCLVTFSLHMPPLAREFLFGGFKAEQPVLFGLSPDRLWLGFSQRMSLGLYGRGGTEKNPEEHVFDPSGEFIIKYAWRREQFETPDLSEQ